MRSTYLPSYRLIRSLYIPEVHNYYIAVRPTEPRL